MKMLDDYFKLQEKIYDYFGYKEDWVVIPFEDRRNFFWHVGEDFVKYAHNTEDFLTGDFYEDEIYTLRFLPKYIYRSDGYTMICVYTHTDGIKFLAIYDNRMEIDTLDEE